MAPIGKAAVVKATEVPDRFFPQVKFFFLARFCGRNLKAMTMADLLMYIPNDETQNHPFCRLNIVVVTFKHLTY